MKLGLGLYRHQLNDEHFRFAAQAGCEALVIHLVDYFNQGGTNLAKDQPTGDLAGWGRAGDPDRLWEEDYLKDVVHRAGQHGLKIAAIENFDPAHWSDVLLDGPRKAAQLENLRTIIRRVGAAGIPCIGYNFSLAGVAGRVRGTFARGGAEAVGMDGPVDDPIQTGMIWNMRLTDRLGPGTIPPCTPEQLWQRLQDFLAAVLPVAEASGVVLAAHPDDPPMPTVRSTPRLVYQPQLYQKLIDLSPSPANQLEYCLGSLAEMTEGDLYDHTDRYSRQRRIAYVHFRNVRGKVPTYKETFVDDGDIDMLRIVRILHRNGYQGVLIPDHAPQMACSAPWHAGMAFALGYMRAALQAVQQEKSLTQPT
jgi:mannonate dehydratase